MKFKGNDRIGRIIPLLPDKYVCILTSTIYACYFVSTKYVIQTLPAWLKLKILTGWDCPGLFECALSNHKIPNWTMFPGCSYREGDQVEGQRDVMYWCRRWMEDPHGKAYIQVVSPKACRKTRGPPNTLVLSVRLCPSNCSKINPCCFKFLKLW
jgi:hypothetical protein